MSAFRASCAAALLLCGCAARLPAPAELEPLEPRAIRRDAVPDELERAASRALALSFAGQAGEAESMVARMRETEAQRGAAGAPASGLVDWAQEAVVAGGGERAYLEHAREQLEREDLDPVLRARMQRMLEQQPFAVAERALGDERRYRAASAFNRVTAPLTRLALGGGLQPFESGRSALRSLLLIHHFPAASARERRALAAYTEYLARDPHGERAAQARGEVERLHAKLARARAETARDSARSALEGGRADSALAFAQRAERALPGDARAAELRQAAERLRAEHAERVLGALGARDQAEPADDARAALVAAVLADPADTLPARAAQARAAGAISAAEEKFIGALALRGPGQDEAFLAALRQTVSLPGPNALGRHAASLLSDPEQNPYRAYRAELGRQRSKLAGWVALGPLAQGPTPRDLPRPVEYLLDVTALPVTLLALPIRALGIPGARRAAAPAVLHAGERYLARFPDGVHAAELHSELESRSASAGLYTSALEHNLARGGSPRSARRYREQIAAALLEAAPRERRPDMRAAVYAELLSKYADTRAAPRARRELAELLENSSPQHIRLSRAFLVEHPSLAAPDALGLRPELLDGKTDNGEIADEGVTLAGQRWVRVALQGREPALVRVPAENLARLAALLDETSYAALASDPREKLVPDAQRDAFLERARLGLLDEPDRRASARSEAQYLSEREKYGLVRTRESILPFELVVTGDIETLGLGAAPQLRLPDPGADAFLYE